MIYRQKIIDALESKSGEFKQFDETSLLERREYLKALNDLKTTTREELTAKLAHVEAPGALPTKEFERSAERIIRFEPEFANHQQARDWAMKVLLDRTTFAVDGSQIMPTKDFSVPVALVQIGWFENPHSHSVTYKKETRLEVMTPDDLLGEQHSDRQMSEGAVGLRRFQMETSRLREFGETAISNLNGTRLPVAFFDNTQVISFADRLRERRIPYVDAILPMLRCSEQTEIPIVGYVDTTFARDLTRMLQITSGNSMAEKIHDAVLLELLTETDKMQWGDRTPFYICAREGILDDYKEFKRRIGFVYMKMSASIPVRVDLPLWIYEADKLDEVLDVIRAEVIVGNGYPYAIETADATAVINVADRDIFYRLFQEFANNHGLDLRFSRKALSKSRRR